MPISFSLLFFMNVSLLSYVGSSKYATSYSNRGSLRKLRNAFDCTHITILLYFSISSLCPIFATAVGLWGSTCNSVVLDDWTLEFLAEENAIGCTFGPRMTTLYANGSMPGGDNPVDVRIIGGSVSSGLTSGLQIVGQPREAYRTVSDLSITVKDMTFKQNAILKFVGYLPLRSSLVITNNTFYMTDRNTLTGAVMLSMVAVRASIILGNVSEPFELSASHIEVSYNTLVVLNTTSVGSSLSTLIALLSTSVNLTAGSALNLTSNAILNSTVAVSDSISILTCYSQGAIYWYESGHSAVRVQNNSLANVSAEETFIVYWRAATWTMAVTNQSIFELTNNSASRALAAIHRSFYWYASSNVSLTVESNSSLSIDRNTVSNYFEPLVTSPAMYVIYWNVNVMFSIRIDYGSTISFRGNRIFNQTYAVTVVFFNIQTIVLAVTKESVFLIANNSIAHTSVSGPCKVIDITTTVTNLAVSESSVFSVSFNFMNAVSRLSLTYVLGWLASQTLAVTISEFSRFHIDNNALYEVYVPNGELVVITLQTTYSNSNLRLSATNNSLISVSSNQALSSTVTRNSMHIHLVYVTAATTTTTFTVALSTQSRLLIENNNITDCTSKADAYAVHWNSAGRVNYYITDNSSVLFGSNTISGSDVVSQSKSVYWSVLAVYVNVSNTSLFAVRSNSIVGSARAGASSSAVYMDLATLNAFIQSESTFIIADNKVADTVNLSNAVFSVYALMMLLFQVVVDSESSFHINSNEVVNLSASYVKVVNWQTNTASSGTTAVSVTARSVFSLSNNLISKVAIIMNSQLLASAAVVWSSPSLTINVSSESAILVGHNVIASSATYATTFRAVVSSVSFSHYYCNIFINGGSSASFVENRVVDINSSNTLVNFYAIYFDSTKNQANVEFHSLLNVSGNTIRNLSAREIRVVSWGTGTMNINLTERATFALSNNYVSAVTTSFELFVVALQPNIANIQLANHSNFEISRNIAFNVTVWQIYVVLVQPTINHYSWAMVATEGSTVKCEGNALISTVTNSYGITAALYWQVYGILVLSNGSSLAILNTTLSACTSLSRIYGVYFEVYDSNLALTDRSSFIVAGTNATSLSSRSEIICVQLGAFDFSASDQSLVMLSKNKVFDSYPQISYKVLTFRLTMLTLRGISVFSIVDNEFQSTSNDVALAMFSLAPLDNTDPYITLSDGSKLLIDRNTVGAYPPLLSTVAASTSGHFLSVEVSVLCDTSSILSVSDNVAFMPISIATQESVSFTAIELDSDALMMVQNNYFTLSSPSWCPPLLGISAVTSKTSLGGTPALAVTKNTVDMIILEVTASTDALPARPWTNIARIASVAIVTIDSNIISSNVTTYLLIGNLIVDMNGICSITGNTMVLLRSEPVELNLTSSSLVKFTNMIFSTTNTGLVVEGNVVMASLQASAFPWYSLVKSDTTSGAAKVLACNNTLYGTLVKKPALHVFPNALSLMLDTCYNYSQSQYSGSLSTSISLIATGTMMDSATRTEVMSRSNSARSSSASLPECAVAMACKYIYFTTTKEYTSSNVSSCADAFGGLEVPLSSVPISSTNGEGQYIGLSSAGNATVREQIRSRNNISVLVDSSAYFTLRLSWFSDDVPSIDAESASPLVKILGLHREERAGGISFTSTIQIDIALTSVVVLYGAVVDANLKSVGAIMLTINGSCDRAFYASHRVSYKRLVLLEAPVMYQPKPAFVLSGTGKGVASVVGVGSITVGAVAVPLAGMQQGVTLALIRMAECDGDPLDGEALDVLVHPLQFALGEGDGRYARGAVVSNLIVIPALWMFLGFIIVPYAYHLATGDTLVLSRDFVAWPGMVATPYAVLSEGTAMSCVGLMTTGLSGDVSLGVIGLVALLLIAGAWIWALSILRSAKGVALESLLVLNRKGLIQIVQPRREWELVNRRVDADEDSMDDLMLELDELVDDESADATGDPPPPKTTPHAISFYSMLRQRISLIGDSWWLWSAVSAHCLSVMVGIAEGLPVSSASLCKLRWSIATISAVAQAAVVMTNTVPLEQALFGISGLLNCVLIILISMASFSDGSRSVNTYDALNALSTVSFCLGIALMLVGMIATLLEVLRERKLMASRRRTRAQSTRGVGERRHRLLSHLDGDSIVQPEELNLEEPLAVVEDIWAPDVPNVFSAKDGARGDKGKPSALLSVPTISTFSNTLSSGHYAQMSEQWASILEEADEVARNQPHRRN